MKSKTQITKEKLSYKEQYELKKEQELKEKATLRKEVLERYAPLLRFHSFQKVLKYAKALDKYPDLKEIDGVGEVDIVIKAYELRELLIHRHQFEHSIEMADGRSSISLGGFKEHKVPDDLPGFDFKKECVKCGKMENTISICPECWERIRIAIGERSPLDFGSKVTK